MQESFKKVSWNCPEWSIDDEKISCGKNYYYLTDIQSAVMSAIILNKYSLISLNLRNNKQEILYVHKSDYSKALAVCDFLNHSKAGAMAQAIQNSVDPVSDDAGADAASSSGGMSASSQKVVGIIKALSAFYRKDKSRK